MEPVNDNGTGKILELFPAEEIDPGIEQMLEDMLERARAGQIRGLVIVADTPASTMLTQSSAVHGEMGLRMMGALDVCKQRIMERVRG